MQEFQNIIENQGKLRNFICKSGKSKVVKWGICNNLE